MTPPESNPVAPQFIVRNYDTSQVPVYVDTSTPFFFVLLEGEITVAYDSFPALTVHPGECLMVMRHSCYRMTVVKPSVGIRVLHTDYLVQNFYRRFGNLTDLLPKGFDYEFKALPAIPAILRFLESVRMAISDGRSSGRLNNLWSEVLTEMTASYYTPLQVARFLFPLIAGDYDFRHMVIENSLSVKDLPELAALCHMSLSTFKRRFKRTFHSSAHSWIAARKAHFIYSEIVGSRKTFVEIAEQFNISSSAYLTAFCKQHFGMTPQEIRRHGHQSPVVVDATPIHNAVAP